MPNTIAFFKPLGLLTLIICLSITNCNNDTRPTTLIQTTQTHIIPNGTYFQYTFTSLKLQQPNYNTSITQYVVSFSLDFTAPFLGSQILYNLLVFPQQNPASEPLYDSFVKATVQGLPGLMPPFPNNNTDYTGSCQDCYQTALYSNEPMACLNCNSTSIQVNLTSQRWSQLQQWNNTIMTVIDNSLVLSPTGGQMMVIMGYQINILYDEQFQALFILFVSVIGALIIILTVLAVFITMRISKVEKEITECKNKVKTQ